MNPVEESACCSEYVSNFLSLQSRRRNPTENDRCTKCEVGSYQVGLFCSVCTNKGIFRIHLDSMKLKLDKETQLVNCLGWNSVK